jgi:ERCC4-type nuclease
MTDHPIRAICLDEQPSPVFNKHFQAWQRTALPLGDPELLLVMAADDTMLVCRYMPTGELLDQIRTQRLPSLLAQLRQRGSDWMYLILDGELKPNTSGKTVHNGNTTGFDWKAVQGALLSIQEAGIGVVWLQSIEHLQDQIYLLAKRDRSQKRVRLPRDVLFCTPAEDLILALPGIGEDRAHVLLKTAGSAAWLLDLLTDLSSPAKLDGIGPETKRKIRQALGLSNQTRLAVLARDAEEAMLPDDPDEVLTAI